MDAQLRARARPLLLLLSLGGTSLWPAAAAAQQGQPAPRPPAVAEAGGEAGAPGADLETLQANLARLLEDAALARAHVGLVVQAAASGRVLFERSAAKRFTAASTTKLVTASVALARLGPDFRWSTWLLADGPVRGGVLEGNLWIVGGGDPGLLRDDVAGWAARLRGAGIRGIAGDVIGDDRALDTLPWGRGWMWDDLYGSWGAGVSALMLHPSRVRAELLPAAAVGGSATLRFRDEGPRPEITARVRTGAPGSETRLRFRPPAEGGPPVLEGWIPADEERVPLSLSPGHPTRHLLDTVASVLAAEGIDVTGRFRRPEADERPPGASTQPEAEMPSDPVPGPGAAARPGGGAAQGPTRDATWSSEVTSRPLGEILQPLLKQSDNQVAEVVLRTLGRELAEGGTAEEGLQVVRETLADWGIEPDAAALADGSGLSRYSELTPIALARLLRRVAQLPSFEAFYEALPVAAVDGTLSRRFTATAADANLRAKTGSMTGVRGLAGFVEDGDGETLIFALLLNGYDAPGDVATALEDLLVEQLALYHGPGYPEGRSRP